ncbi:MAG: hypothetical protein IKG79_09315 [Neisseriaceae bacterium]|nr:hypothetical protein [Neisseriaceae bacterium]
MAEKNQSQEVSGNLNALQTIEEMERTLRIAKCLQGEPVCVLNERLAPHSGIGDLRKWATGVLKVFGEKAVNFEIGEIICDERSIKNSFAHGLNPFKVEAVRSIKDVIEQGVVFAQTKVGREEHYFIAAPVVIENKEDIVTILAKRDMNTQRMYLHSVATKESILNKDFSQNKTPETLVPSADTEVSELSGKLYSGDISRILQNYLKVNIRELEVEINQQIEQQKGNKMAQENENTTNAMQPESHRQQQFVADTMAKYPIKDGEPSIVWSLLWNDDSANRSIPNFVRMSVQAAETIYSRLDEMVAQEKRGYDTVVIGGEEINPESHRGRTGLFGYRFELGRNDGSLLGALAIDNIHHKDLLKLATYLTPETQNRLLERLSQPTTDYAYDLTETMLENKKAFAELLQTQIQQQTKQATYSQDNPYAAYAKDDETAQKNADDWEMREPLTGEKLSHFNELAKKQGFTTYVENHHADTGVFQADKKIDETYSIEIIGQFKNHGSQDAFESARDFTMTFHQGDEIVHYFYTNQLDKALEQAAEFSKNPAQWIENKDKTVEQHLSDLVDETIAIMQKHSVKVESLDFQFTHKGLADRSAAFNQELLKLTPEQLKELQPYFEQHKAIQTLQGLYEQTNDTARLEEITTRKEAH